MEGWRRVFKKTPLGHWQEVNIADIRQGDVLTFWEPNGDPVLYKGELLVKATSDTFLDVEERDFKVEIMTLKEWEEKTT
jgi:hypothetical protein